MKKVLSSIFVVLFLAIFLPFYTFAQESLVDFSINPLYDTSSSLTGFAPFEKKVVVLVGSEQIGEAIAKDGKFKVSIPKQQVGTTLEARVMDAEGEILGSQITTVVDASIQTASTAYNKIRISWSEVPGAEGYEVYRSTSSSGTYKRIGTVSDGSAVRFTNDVKTGQTYFYRIRAYRTINGEKVLGPNSRNKSAKAILINPNQVTSKQSSIAATEISWIKVAGAHGYRVYRSESKNGTYKGIGTVKKGSILSFIDKNQIIGKTYFYKVKAYRTVDGINVWSKFSPDVKQVVPKVNRSIETLRLVDKQNGLPKNYVPKLITPNVRYSTNIADRKKMTSEAGRALERMFADANKAGIILYAQSGYRSYATQQSLYQNYVKRHGQKEADTFSARPGHSEHQTGLAMDITSKSVNLQLTERFADTKEGKWLKKHASKYGFVISYPKGKTHITGYVHEPWHFRYVGVDHALYMDKHNLTLKEYLEQFGR